MLRLIGILVTLVAAMAAAVITWPQFFRLEQVAPIAQIVALRAGVVLGALAVAVVFLLLCLARPLRAFAGAIVTIALLTAAANGAILLVRGTGTDSLPDKDAGSIRVLTWNTAGAATDPTTIAQAAVAMQADIIALPETTLEAGTQVAVTMREMGHPMWAHHESYQDREGYEEWAANSTTLLISPDLGDYAVVQSTSDGTTGTSRLPSVVAMPVSGSGPVVVVAHAVAPRPQAMGDWSQDLQWLADQCGTDDVIMAGDFNATVDHMQRLGVDGGTLGRCSDAAQQTGNGGVGTWNTAWPKLLGAPIDHVLATKAWRPSGSVVLSGLDDAGSDHRPLVVQLEPAAP
ncbi:endonuclease/exonuclease/phosphatase family protein [Microbacterium sp. W1N]|uniref:endonuclease/exonuclease/phosphatase family protein n=1 Tax=Microbacterium festucae TaxID=2977531 RepID=UPI0021C0F336|nr:endonuclease/exonuclease/phosphatase family protein [Microbacterium festucae]MCT9820448.1 endonuclease/exonuclease/phosphatase family protein [Microbacterium festucae]